MAAVRHPPHRSSKHKEPDRVVCVKFCNWALVPSDRLGEPPASVAAVAARCVDCLQLLEVDMVVTGTERRCLNMLF